MQIASTLQSSRRKGTIMTQFFKPMGKAANLVESMGLKVTHAYDDLVFVEHTAFLIQFTDSDDLLRVLFNTDCPDEDRKDLTEAIRIASQESGVPVEIKGTFSLSQKEDENLEIKFLD